MPRPPNHTDATKAKLRALWADSSMSPRDIAAVMGLSRCAVLGLRFRMNLPLRGKSTKKDRSMAKTELFELKRNECAFPIGEPDHDDFKFCCASVVRAGATYCARHYSITHRAPTEAEVRTVRRTDR